MENVNVAPGETVSVGIGATRRDILSAAAKTISSDPSCVKVNAGEGSDMDIYLNVSWVLKRQDGLLPAGYEVAYAQIPILSLKIPVHMSSPAVSSAMVTFLAEDLRPGRLKLTSRQVR